MNLIHQCIQFINVYIQKLCKYGSSDLQGTYLCDDKCNNFLRVDFYFLKNINTRISLIRICHIYFQYFDFTG